jgi:hypothetical protein
MDPLAGLDPKLLQYLRSQGLSREDIVKNVGVQQVIDGAEAKKQADNRLTEMRSPQMQEQLRDQIAAGLETNKSKLMSTTNPAELKAQLREIASNAVTRVNASSGSNPGGGAS